MIFAHFWGEDGGLGGWLMGCRKPRKSWAGWWHEKGSCSWWLLAAWLLAASYAPLSPSALVLYPPSLLLLHWWRLRWRRFLVSY